MSRNHYQESDPGITWIKDEAVVIDLDDLDASRVLTPNVVVLPDGSYRLYYYSSGTEQHKEAGSAGYVASAVSADGSAWTKKCMDTKRMFRGGGWSVNVGHGRPAARNWDKPKGKYRNLGLRCVK